MFLLISGVLHFPRRFWERCLPSFCFCIMDQRKPLRKSLESCCLLLLHEKSIYFSSQSKWRYNFVKFPESSTAKVDFDGLNFLLAEGS